MDQAISIPSYDLRTNGYLPAVRNQNPTGTCWAHAALGSLESNAIKKGLVNNSVNFAESQLAYFAYYPSTNSSDPLYGDYYSENYYFNSGTNAYDCGGNYDVATGVLARGTGPLTETSELAVSKRPGSSVMEPYRYFNSGYYLTDTFKFDKTETDEIKNYIYSNGSVAVSYYVYDYNAGYTKVTDTSSNYYGQYCFYYANGESSTNHAVTIVGWDDNFPKEYFTDHGTPSSNGAWICRNSWGSYGSGTKDGYFYMSYEEPTLSSFYAVQAGSTSDIGNTIYQYDGSLLYGAFAKKAANVFTSKNSDPLRKVSFSTISASTAYTISIYSDITEGQPESGTLLCTESGNVSRAGYHVIDLEKQVSVPYGTKFSVVVELDKPGFTEDNNASTGQSYEYWSGSWRDYGESDNANIGIKAFTASSSDVVPVPANLSATAGDQSVTLSWSAVSGASQYRIYSYDPSAKTYKYIDYSTSTSYKITNLEAGKTYYYVVTAYKNSTESGYSNQAKAIPTSSLSSPVITSTIAGDGSVQLFWSEVSGAVCYYVYMYDSYSDYLNNNYSSDISISGLTYSFSSLTNGKTYYFNVAAVNYSTTSAKSSYAEVTPKEIKAQNLKAIAGDQKAELSWDAVENATGYNVYKKSGSSYTYIASTTLNNYTVTGLTNGTTYEFAVRSVVADNLTSYSDSVRVKPIAGISASVTPLDSAARVTWTAISGASKYYVVKFTDEAAYQKNNWSSGYQYSSSDSECKFTTLTNGTTYYLAVLAYDSNSNMFAKSALLTVTPKRVSYNITAKASPTNGGTITIDKNTGYNGDYVSFTATAATGYKLVEFTCEGDGSYISTASYGSTGGNGKVKVGDEDVIITAVFEALESYTISSTVSPTSSGTVTLGKTTAYTGDTVTISATPAAGYKFSKWTYSGTGASISSTTSSSATLTVGSGNVAVTANFVKESYTVSSYVYPSSSGTVTLSKTSANKGDYVTISATPAAGYKFSKWTYSGTGASISSTTSSSATLTVGTANVTVTANFSKETYSISSSVYPSNSGTVNLSNSSATYGYKVSVSATPAAGYTFKQWTVSDASASISDIYSQSATLTVGTADVVVTAEFESSASALPAPKNIRANLDYVWDDLGIITVEWDAVPGAEQYYLYVTNDGYGFWSVDGTSATISMSINQRYGFYVTAYDADTGLESERSEIVYLTVEEPVAAFVERLYTTLMGRASDPKGKADHVSRLKAGQSACDVAKGFVLSPELKGKNLSNEEFVTRMYKTMLDRTPDAKGLANWTKALDNGCSYGYILQGFCGSSEFTNLCASYGVTRGTYKSSEYRDYNAKLTAYVSRMYTVAMGRNYDVVGLNNHTRNYVNKIKDAKGIAKDFIFSPEFKQKNLTDEQFVECMYNTLFGRKSDSAGKNGWLSKMKNGMSRQQVFDGFAGADEFKKMVAGFGV